jgi:hypothetical protein
MGTTRLDFLEDPSQELQVLQVLQTLVSTACVANICQDESPSAGD